MEQLNEALGPGQDQSTVPENDSSRGESTRPGGIPDDWVEEPSKKGGGSRFHKPGNRHNSARVMPGNPNSPNPAQRDPYVKRMKDGKALDVNGNVVDKDSPEAHIPLADFKFMDHDLK